MEPTLVELRLRAMRKPWTELKIGLSLADIFALGVHPSDLGERILKLRQIVLSVPMDRAELRAAWLAWREANGLPVPEKRGPKPKLIKPKLIGLSLSQRNSLAALASVESRRSVPKRTRPCLSCKRPFTTEEAGRQTARLCDTCKHNLRAMSSAIF